MAWVPVQQFVGPSAVYPFPAFLNSGQQDTRFVYAVQGAQQTVPTSAAGDVVGAQGQQAFLLTAPPAGTTVMPQMLHTPAFAAGGQQFLTGMGVHFPTLLTTPAGFPLGTGDDLETWQGGGRGVPHGGRGSAAVHRRYVQHGAHGKGARRVPPAASTSAAEAAGGPVSSAGESPRRDLQLQGPLRAATDTPPTLLAGAIALHLRVQRCAEVQAMGPDAVSRAVGAFIMTRSYVTGDGLRVFLQAEFVQRPGPQPQSTLAAIRFLVRAFPGASGELNTAHQQPASSADVVRGPGQPIFVASRRQEMTVGSAAGAVAKATRGAVRQGRPVVVVSGSGHAEVNKAVKALVLARAMLAQDAIDIHFQPYLRSEGAPIGHHSSEDYWCEGLMMQVLAVCAPHRVGIDPQTHRTGLEHPVTPVFLNPPLEWLQASENTISDSEQAYSGSTPGGVASTGPAST
eukprot:TRINITY_DN8625_c0_g1_i3.p1 TRINITY_DN8625_c0_g1~~TRINITY_DN8625_c0_g1_i3.p1  ORF type:complete len:501 (+),score=54.69 TRINITY_DN8625_c0_g1_i3:137-1504(+)